jgi:hypothetical protein
MLTERMTSDHYRGLLEGRAESRQTIADLNALVRELEKRIRDQQAERTEVHELRQRVRELEAKLDRSRDIIGAAFRIGQPPWYVMGAIETREWVVTHKPDVALLVLLAAVLAVQVYKSW